jgi:hypothetical protein
LIPFSDEALKDVPDPYPHLVAAHPTPMLERFTPFTPYIFISTKKISVRGDRLIELRKHFGSLNKDINIHVEADPTGYYVFFGDGIKYTYWALW